jgi:hypothetical protein
LLPISLRIHCSTKPTTVSTEEGQAVPCFTTLPLPLTAYQVLTMVLGALYIESPFGCWPKSSKFQSIGLLKIVKLGPRVLYWGPIQTSSHPTWWPTWHKYGAKTLGLTKANGPKFFLSKLQNLGPIASIEPPPLYEIHLRHGPSNGSKGFTLRGPIVDPFTIHGPNCCSKYPIKWISFQMGWVPNIKCPLVWLCSDCGPHGEAELQYKVRTWHVVSGSMVKHGATSCYEESGPSPPLRN